MDKITFSHFKKLLTCQPYFIWNKMDTTIVEEDEDEEGEEQFSFGFNFGDIVEEAQISALEVQAKSFSIIEKKFYEREVKSSKDKLIIGKTLEERWANTQAALADENIDRLIRPLFTFEYKGFNVVATPSVWDKKTSQASFLKLSASTKKSDLLRVFFECMVLEKLGHKVKNITTIVLATKEYKKGEIDFYETESIRLGSESKDAKAAKEILDYQIMQLSKTGEDKDDPSVHDIFKDKYIKFGRPVKEFDLFELEYYLDRIIAAKEVVEPVQPQEIDNSMWGANKAFPELVKKFLPQYEGYNGKIVKKDAVISLVDLDDIASKSTTLFEIINNEEPVLNDKALAQKLIEPLNDKVVWYDFEAFSLPICPLEGMLPFQQTISQVSIIRTENLIQQDEGTQNIVVDPKNIEHEDFYKIIKAIYWKGASYVVYNKSYENTRLKEMVRLFKKYDYDFAYEAEKMVEEIIEKTVDLADAFSCSANKPAWIQIPYIKGKHSIKLLEKYITAKRPDVTYRIKEYKSLEVQNGMMAMELANNRALGIIGDEQWSQEVPKLKEYCENDVRAMIMVYYLIKELVK